ncbi:MAG TPA: cytochrome c biogenesis heme-transporting ATPase CcmA [Casimicrobiaceae bacterium]
MLQAQDLAARRGDATLFSGIGFSLSPGSALIVGGPNGSGKTTLLRILAGLVHPTRGTVAWRGAEVGSLDPVLRAQALFIGHAAALKDELTAEENLASLTSLHGVQANPAELADALASWALSRQHALPARVLSQGQRRRVALARLALLPRALWLLDEPATALDDAGVARLREAIAAHLAGGGIAVIATHQELALPAGASQPLHLA